MTRQNAEAMSYGVRCSGCRCWVTQCICEDNPSSPPETSAPELPTAVWSGTFTLFGQKIRCHTLSNGMRIIEEDSMRRLLDAMIDGDGPAENDMPIADMIPFMRWRQGDV